MTGAGEVRAGVPKGGVGAAGSRSNLSGNG
jgi:hypothetical protein